MERQRVVVGISGGVDSAVCAAMLQEQGYDVIGVFLEISEQTSKRAKEVCDQLGVPLIISDIRDTLREEVMVPFALSYCRGLTPNPCILCNPTIKFPVLAKIAKEHEAAYIATGHYVQTAHNDGVTFLRRGMTGRDQSYMLYRLPQSILSKCLFPLGSMDKVQVRDKARSKQLGVAEAPDSMDICFVPDGDYSGFIEGLGYTTSPGDIVSVDGTLLGRHLGLHHYTIGQRRGLGISAAARLFVVGLDVRRNQVILGEDELLYPKAFMVSQLVLLPTVSLPLQAEVRVRYSKGSALAEITALSDNRALVTFTGTPARAPTPGQSAVFYQGDVVVGGGFIQPWRFEE